MKKRPRSATGKGPNAHHPNAAPSRNDPRICFDNEAVRRLSRGAWAPAICFACPARRFGEGKHDAWLRIDRLTMGPMPKQDADAYDRLLDAAAALADLISAAGIAIEEDAVEELTIFLAEHGMIVARILKNLRRTWP